MNTLILGKEQDYFVENLSMLISSAMPIIAVLDSIASEMRSRRIKKRND
jgi:type II secretory pathway component PulF